MFIYYCCLFIDIHDICESHLAYAIWCHPPRQKHSLSSQLQIKRFGRDYVSFTRGGTCSGKECQYFFIGMVIIELNRPPSWWCLKFGGIHINLQNLWLQCFFSQKKTHQLYNLYWFSGSRLDHLPVIFVPQKIPFGHFPRSTWKFHQLPMKKGPETQ